MGILSNPQFKGDVPVMIHVKDENGMMEEMDTGCRIACDAGFMAALEKLIGTKRFGRWPRTADER